MEVGQVSYHDKTKVKRMRVEKDNAIVNNLNRTKEVRFHLFFSLFLVIRMFLKLIFHSVFCSFYFLSMNYFLLSYFFTFLLFFISLFSYFSQERYPDLAAMQEERAAEFRLANKIEKRTQMQVEKANKRERDVQANIRNYSYVHRTSCHEFIILSNSISYNSCIYILFTSYLHHITIICHFAVFF